MKLVVTNNYSEQNYTQGVPKCLECLTFSLPGHVPPIILPLLQKARSASAEVYWIHNRMF